MAEVKDKKRGRFFALLLMLVASGVVINLWQYSDEARAPRRPLKEFPSSVGAWRQLGADVRFDAETESILRADDYISRNYAGPGGIPANLYIAYYETQRKGATYHSPLNCLPGSGWTMNEAGRVTIRSARGTTAFEANRYIVEQGSDRQLLVYWYQGRGRAVASEYWGKIYTVTDSIFRHRSDGALVRVMVPLPRGQSEQAALEAATNLATEIAPLLPTYIPD